MLKSSTRYLKFAYTLKIYMKQYSICYLEKIKVKHYNGSKSFIEWSNNISNIDEKNIEEYNPNKKT